MIYYDIHTHHKSTSDKDVCSIYNLTEDDILLGTNLDTSSYYSCGIHPWHAEGKKMAIDDLRKKALSNNRIVAIGEVGLDSLVDVAMDVQMDIFVQQIELAIDLKLPMIIHCVKAWDDIIRLYREYKPTHPWILHGFRGGKNQAEQLTKLGFYFSLGEYYNQEALSVIYPDRLFVETDESELKIEEIYRTISKDLGQKKEDFQLTIEQNVSLVFDLHRF